jgi:AcrR family transcriptional regulator
MKAKLGPRTKPPEVRREEIMDAAERLFLAQGVGSTTIDDVAAGAEVAKGTVYLHFDSRRALLTALGDRFGERHLVFIKAALAAKSEVDWPGKLAAWAESCVTFYLDRIALHDMLFHEAAAHNREGLVDNLIIHHLTWLLNAGVEAGAWAIDDSRFAAVFLFSGMHGIVDDAYLKEKRIFRGRLVKRLQSICFRTVGMTLEQQPG